jgi:hypothetical protein
MTKSVPEREGIAVDEPPGTLEVLLEVVNVDDGTEGLVEEVREDVEVGAARPEDVPGTHCEYQSLENWQ